jgi:hypothetical protein
MAGVRKNRAQSYKLFFNIEFGPRVPRPGGVSKPKNCSPDKVLLKSVTTCPPRLCQFTPRGGSLKAAHRYGPREHAMFLFAVAHGARAQEIANLRLQDINFKK